MSLNMKLPFGSKKHRLIKEALCERHRRSREKMQTRSKVWTTAEEKFRAYIPEKEVDAQRRNLREDGTPQFTTVEIPFSYATLLAAHTYHSSVFLNRSPIHQFTARHGEPTQKVQAVEALMDYQVLVGGALVPYYIWLMDANKYGLGVLGQYWDEEILQVSEYVEKPMTINGFEIEGRTQRVKQTRRFKGYTGNKLYNVRPQNFFPDPRVEIMNFQKGEFCGRIVDIGWNTIVEGVGKGKYFNVDKLERMRGAGGEDMQKGSSQLEEPDNQGTSVPFDLTDMGTVSVLEMHVKLIPFDWGLGDSRYPEKWVFSLADKEVLIEARPYGAYHGKFPFDVLEREIEGYGFAKRGLPETIEPLNDVMTWLINTHFYNVRKVLNDQFIVDPSKVVMKDVKDPKAGKLIRLRPEAYGTDVRTAMTQLQVVDVTQQNIADLREMTQLIQRVSGVTDNIMGMVNAGGRKTATEVRSSNTFGANRLKTEAEYMSAMGFAPHAQTLVQTTQQYYDSDKQFKIAGDLMENQVPFMDITPEDISGFYDFVPVDGTLPIDRFAQVNMWTQFFTQARNFPELFQQYDVGGIFSWVMQLGGLRNIKQFRVNTVPDQQLEDSVQAGNSVPIGEGNARGNSGGPRSGISNDAGGAASIDDGALKSIPTPRELASMG